MKVISFSLSSHLTKLNTSMESKVNSPSLTINCSKQHSALLAFWGAQLKQQLPLHVTCPRARSIRACLWDRILSNVDGKSRYFLDKSERGETSCHHPTSRIAVWLGRWCLLKQMAWPESTFPCHLLLWIMSSPFLPSIPASHPPTRIFFFFFFWLSSKKNNEKRKNWNLHHTFFPRY